jgi:hypothetical protein
MITYTESHIAADNISKAEDQNRELAGALAEMNGALDAHQMPLASVGYNSLAGAAALLDPHDVASTRTIGPFSATYVVSGTSTLTFSEADENTFAGWNDLDPSFVLSFQAKEGMLSGSAVIGCEKNAVLNGANEYGNDFWFRIGVFINNILVADTDEIPAGAYTVDIPYAVPIGSETVTIAIKWIAPTYVRALPAMALSSDPKFSVYNRHLYVKNKYR